MSASIPISVNPSKRPRLATNKRDRFTNLHENMVSNILSRLPTKDAVRTSILSKAWEHKWTSMYNIDIDGEYDYDDNNEKFINFMNKVFGSTEHLRSVRLLCRSRTSKPRYTARQIWQYRRIYKGRPDPSFLFAREKWFSSFQKWVYDSLRHNLEYFEVFHCNEGIFYPSTLLNQTSLRKLILGPSNTKLESLVSSPSHGTLYVSSVNCASNLTSMSLGQVTLVNENPICTTVTFNLPTLQTLAFNQCKWLNVKHLKIYAPSLTAFTSQVVNTHNDDDYDYTIEVVSPRLTTFKCTSEKFIMDVSSVVSASLSLKEQYNPKVGETMGSRARNLINKFSCLQEFELSGRIVAKEIPLRCHDKVTRLTLHNMISWATDELFELLHAMPSLNFWILHGPAYIWNDYDNDAIESIPSCISSQLEEVVIQTFYKFAREYGFVVFLLNTAAQLKKLTIWGLCCDQEDIKKVLSAYSSCSSALVVDIVTVDIDEML